MRWTTGRRLVCPFLEIVSRLIEVTDLLYLSKYSQCAFFGLSVRNVPLESSRETGSTSATTEQKKARFVSVGSETECPASLCPLLRGITLRGEPLAIVDSVHGGQFVRNGHPRQQVATTSRDYDTPFADLRRHRGG